MITNKHIKKYRQSEKYKQAQKAWHSSEHGKLSVLKSRLKTKFGITLEDYNNLIIKHNNSCAICSTPQTVLATKLCIDHNHTTGKVRGLLCDPCNVALGLFKDNQALLQKALDYLKEMS